jgi:hypothetical protein
MTHTVILIACAVVLAGGLPQAPATAARPDFSGRWTSDPLPDPAASGARGRGRGPARGDMGSGWGPTITITQDATSLTVEYAFFARGDLQPPLRFVYALDGTESRNSVMMGRGVQVQRSRAQWDGAALKVTTAHALTDPATGKPVSADISQTLSLTSPTELVVETTRAGVLGGPTTTTRTVYRKL